MIYYSEDTLNDLFQNETFLDDFNFPKSDLGPLDNNAFFLLALICLIVAMWPPLNNS